MDPSTHSICYWQPVVYYISNLLFQGLDADEYVEGMKKKGIRVPGIGHRIKSKDNRDKRVELLQNYARRCVAYSHV